jgi:hypothetical protein
MVIKDMKILHSKVFQNVPKLGIWFENKHLATLLLPTYSTPVSQSPHFIGYVRSRATLKSGADPTIGCNVQRQRCKNLQRHEKPMYVGCFEKKYFLLGTLKKALV